MRELHDCVGFKISKEGRVGAREGLVLMFREDRIATKCTGDKLFPVLQGQVPLHKHMQRDLISH